MCVKLAETRHVVVLLLLGFCVGTCPVPWMLLEDGVWLQQDECGVALAL